jgi:hypothetical protein
MCAPVSKLKTWTVIERVGAAGTLITDTASDVEATKTIKARGKAAKAAEATAA